MGTVELRLDISVSNENFIKSQDYQPKNWRFPENLKICLKVVFYHKYSNISCVNG